MQNEVSEKKKEILALAKVLGNMKKEEDSIRIIRYVFIIETCLDRLTEEERNWMLTERIQKLKKSWMEFEVHNPDIESSNPQKVQQRIELMNKLERQTVKLIREIK